VELASTTEDPSITQVDTIFEALGAIAVCTASRPIEAVLLAPVDNDVADLVHSAEAIRRLDATVQVIIVSAQPIAPSIAEHFDGHIAPPIDRTRVGELLDGTGSAVDPPPRESPAPDIVPTPSMLPEPAPGPASAPPVPPGTGQICDTDLVEAMLHDARGVQHVAIRLIMQQTNWPEVRIDPVNAGLEHGAGIQFGGKDFGVLTVPGRSPESIRPWAQWIARWLALDDAQRELRDMAFRDELTAAWNRRYLKQFLSDSIEEARTMRRQLTVMVFDIDDFKSYNDRYGHAAGDTILLETVQMLGSVIRDGDRVCRIGGDEFAVVFADLQAPRKPGSTHPDSVESIARRFQQQICEMRFPELGIHAPGTLSISGGLASFPWDGHDGPELLRIADERAIESKRRGKNCLTIGPGAQTEWPQQE
jgi:diguanylate cyclase (GGDEF)-like protein